MPTRDLNGAVVAVVGANGGLGREITVTLARRGAIVVRCTRSGGPDSDVTLDLRDARAGDVVAEDGGSAGEAIAGQLHPVAGVAGEPDDYIGALLD